jgi:phage FluMu protein Com
MISADKFRCPKCDRVLKIKGGKWGIYKRVKVLMCRKCNKLKRVVTLHRK